MKLNIKINKEENVKEKIISSLEQFRNNTITENARNFSPLAKQDLIITETITNTDPKVLKNFKVGNNGRCRFNGFLIRWTVISKQFLLITYLKESETNTEPGEIICSRAKWNLSIISNKEAFNDLVANTDFKSEFNKPILSKKEKIVIYPTKGSNLDLRKEIKIKLAIKTTIKLEMKLAGSIQYEEFSFRSDYSILKADEFTKEIEVLKILNCREPKVLFKERQINNKLIEGFLNKEEFILNIFIKKKYEEDTKPIEIKVILTNKKELLLQIINDQRESLLREVENDQIDELKRFIEFYGKTDPIKELKEKILRDIDQRVTGILKGKTRTELIRTIKEAFESSTQNNFEEKFIFMGLKIEFILKEFNKLPFTDSKNILRYKILRNICENITSYFKIRFNTENLVLDVPAYGDVLGYEDLIEITEEIKATEKIPENSIVEINSFFIKTTKRTNKAKVRITKKEIHQETIKIGGEEIIFKGTWLEEVDKTIKNKLTQYEGILSNIKFMYPDIEEIEFIIK